MGRVIASTEDYKITYYDNNSNILFVVFHTMMGDIDTEPFGFEFLTSCGYSIVSVNNRLGSQYQGLSYEDFKRLVKPLTVSKQVYLYGSSLGAYCALYYAGAVAGTVIGVSPRNPSHPHYFDKYGKPGTRYDIEFKHNYHFNENDITNKPVYLFYDSKNRADRDFILDVVLHSYPDAIVHNIDYAGHAHVLRHLLLVGVFKRIINSIVLNKENIESLLYESLQKDSDYTHFGKIEMLYMRRIQKHLKAIENPKLLGARNHKKYLKWRELFS